MRKKCLSILLAFVLLAFAGCTAPATSQETPEPPVDVTETAVGTEATTPAFAPGTYTIETMGHNGKMVVDVTLSDNAITDIQVVEHAETRRLGNIGMDTVIAEILERQSLDVDTVSGASVSGAVVRAAVVEAVEQAGGDTSALMIPAEEDTTEYSDITTQVVIVGSGVAGLTTAVQAQESGLEVILVEQLGLLGGSSIRAAYMVGGGSSVQAEQGIDYTVEDWAAFQVKPRTNTAAELYQEASAIKLSAEAGNNISWLYDLGVNFGAVNLNFQHYGPNGERIGSYVVETLQNALDEHGVDYRLNTRATELITEDGKVCGVTVQSPNGQIYNINADDVVLCTGGFFGNQEMVDQYDPAHAMFHSDVSIGADGSGMKMAEAVGAQLGWMDQGNYHGLATFWNGASRGLTLPAGNGCVAVNQEGKRYANEAGNYELLAQGTIDQGGTVYTIMDQALMDLNVIQQDHGLSAVPEIWVKADTLEELADKLGIDKEGFLQTMADYASYVANGEDLEFGKAATFMRSDFTTGPYYGCVSGVENHTNHGGIVVDIDNHALTEAGEIIPGLFAVGECAATHIQGIYTFSAAVGNARFTAQLIADELLG
ncbi:MAG: FAD-dependent oxidoreductase [Clostridia bacterium]|nr:FAD-dependent oxidoreductase [Clostridia bacterium]